MTGIFSNVKIDANFAINEDEAQKYIAEVVNHAECRQDDIKSIKLTLEGEDVTIEYTLRKEKFERIRRITGYLVGTVDRWNNGKRAELKDRLKHA